MAIGTDEAQSPVRKAVWGGVLIFLLAAVFTSVGCGHKEAVTSPGVGPGAKAYKPDAPGLQPNDDPGKQMLPGGGPPGPPKGP